MELGFALPQAGSWATPQNQATVARRAEELGLAGLWTAQRLLYPDAPRDEWPAAPGPDHAPTSGRPREAAECGCRTSAPPRHPSTWPPTFRSFLDPIASLAYVAALTSRIRLGTSSLMLPLFSPVLLAKQLASVDVLSGGRLDVGVSLGWSRDEFAAVGTPFERRGARFEAYVRALIAAWTGTAMDTEFVTLPPGEVRPAPAQRPHPPLFIGGYSDAALRRTVTYGRGYLAASTIPLDTVGDVLARLHGHAEAAGRDPKELKLVCRGVTALTATPAAPGGRPLTGTVEQIAADVARYAEAGVDHLFLDLNFDPAVGTVGADADASMDHALGLLEALGAQGVS